MGLNKIIGKNLAKPSGWFGNIVGYFMSVRNNSLNKWTVELLELTPNDNVLEIGFGVGVTIKSISKVAYRGLTSGIDYSETMFRKATQLNSKSISEGRVTLTTGDATYLPYQDEFFDKICSIHCIYFWPEPQKTLQEAWRVLRNGGT